MLRAITLSKTSQMRQFRFRSFLTQRKLSTANAPSTNASELVLEQNRRKLGYWFLGTGALVAGMVVVGGITRLTRSGLSMTSWKLQGSLPPTSKEEWEKEFERYKTFPEWQQRQSMTLEEFKFIYFWEYSHRMMGRMIGFAFVLPGVYFGIRGMIPKALYPRVFLLFGLGGGQGLIGWWMVRSGLDTNIVDPNQKKEIRVSPYRLATHLVMAFTTYTLLIKTGLNQFYPHESLMKMTSHLTSEVVQFARKSRKFALHNAALAAVTVLTGAYVAGNDAGRAYNTFPKMGDDWLPPKEDLFPLQPLWRNFVETTGLVQFDHRVMAISTASAITLMYAQARRALQGQYWQQIPKALRFGYNASMGMVLVQVGLGISTLLMYVPTELAAAHQAGAIVLLTMLTGLVHTLGFSKYGKKLANPVVVQKVAGLVNKKFL